MIPTVCKFTNKQLNHILLFVIKFGHEDLQIGKDHTLGYLVTTHYEALSPYGENTSIESLDSNSLTTDS